MFRRDIANATHLKANRGKKREEKLSYYFALNVGSLLCSNAFHLITKWINEKRAKNATCFH